MKLVDYGIMVIGSLLVGAAVLSMVPTKQIEIPVKVKDTTIQVQDTVLSVKGKRALFIGDSHTAAAYGWQYQVCKATGMTYNNTAVGGKQTGWMVTVAQQYINKDYDYCFIYGGANDMASNRPPMKSVHNIQKIVDLCNQNGVHAVVLTGFNPLTCVDVTGREPYKGYPQRYAIFQQLLLDSIVGATVIKTHSISRTDCGDFLCHMTASGHRKMGEAIIRGCRFKKL